MFGLIDVLLMITSVALLFFPKTRALGTASSTAFAYAFLLSFLIFEWGVKVLGEDIHELLVSNIVLLKVVLFTTIFVWSYLNSKKSSLNS